MRIHVRHGTIIRTGIACKKIPLYKSIEFSMAFNPNLGRGGGGSFTRPHSWFSLNNSKTVKAVALDFGSI